MLRVIHQRLSGFHINTRTPTAMTSMVTMVIPGGAFDADDDAIPPSMPSATIANPHKTFFNLSPYEFL